MTVPKWLIPVLAGVAALAVGITTALVAAQFAPTRSTEVAAPVVSVPVLAPVDPGAPADQASAVVTETEVTLPGENPAELPADLVAIIGALGASADPAMTLIALDDATDPTVEPAVDDVCAPREGEPAVECPDGLRSTVLSLVAEREFTPAGQAYPPTRDELLAEGNPWRPLLWCDGLTATDTTVPFGILSGIPGSYTLEYWPTHRPGTAMRVDVEASEAEIAEYRAALATVTRTGDLPFSRTCVELEVEPDTAYTLVINGIDINGRLAPPRTERFHSGREPVHPGAEILGVGDNYLVVTARHPLDETVDIRVRVGEPATLPACSALGSTELLEPLTDGTGRASEEEVAAAAAPPHFVSKRVTGYHIPEGATALVCVRWYPAGSAPSWERETPSYESSAIVQSPDRLNPLVTLTNVDRANPDIHTLDLAVSSVSGSLCGTTRWTPETELPIVLCRGATGVVPGRDGPRVWDIGVNGDLAVTTTEYWGERNLSVWPAMLHSRETGCRGSCRLPAPQNYRLAPRQGTFVDITVSWEFGRSNGQRWWSITPVTDAAPEIVTPEFPRIDLNRAWEFSDIVWPSGRTFDAPVPHVAAKYTVHADRPVDFVLRLTQEGSPGVAAAACTTTGGPLEVRGRAERPTPVEIPGACLGAHYLAELEVTDDEGRTALWSLRDRERFWGTGGAVQVPAVPVTIQADVAAQSTTHSYVYDLDLTVGDASMRLMDERFGRCSVDGLVDATATAPVQAGSHVRVTLNILLTRTDPWHPTDCVAAPGGESMRRIDVTVPLESLFAPGGARIEVPSVYRTVIVLKAVR